MVMPNVVEAIPAGLKPAAEAALAWINKEQGAQFEITGLVDPEKATGQEAGQPIELGLVLCDGDQCRREQVRVEPTPEGFEVRAAGGGSPVIPPHLDPPAGARESWLEGELGKHSFIVLLFYRGLW